MRAPGVGVGEWSEPAENLRTGGVSDRVDVPRTQPLDAQNAYREINLEETHEHRRLKTRNRHLNTE